MKLIILILTLFSSIACNKFDSPSYKQIKDGAKYKVGDTIAVDEGYFKGCSLLVKEVIPTPRGYVKYTGISKDCPDMGGVIE